jgi:predicted nucleic acid-binding protein
MKKNRKNIIKPSVFFNASVIIAGILSPNGGSSKILGWVKEGKIKGVISEVVFDEVLRHASKIGKERNFLAKQILSFRFKILNPPERLNPKYEKIVEDKGDVHILTSASYEGVIYLVSLDAKHILLLRNRVNDFKILSPGELIKKLS